MASRPELAQWKSFCVCVSPQVTLTFCFKANQLPGPADCTLLGLLLGRWSKRKTSQGWKEKARTLVFKQQGTLRSVKLLTKPRTWFPSLSHAFMLLLPTALISSSSKQKIAQRVRFTADTQTAQLYWKKMSRAVLISVAAGLIYRKMGKSLLMMLLLRPLSLSSEKGDKGKKNKQEGASPLPALANSLESKTLQIRAEKYTQGQ